MGDVFLKAKENRYFERKERKKYSLKVENKVLYNLEVQSLEIALQESHVLRIPPTYFLLYGIVSPVRYCVHLWNINIRLRVVNCKM